MTPDLSPHSEANLDKLVSVLRGTPYFVTRQEAADAIVALRTRVAELEREAAAARRAALEEAAALCDGEAAEASRNRDAIGARYGECLARDDATLAWGVAKGMATRIRALAQPPAAGQAASGGDEGRA